MDVRRLGFLLTFFWATTLAGWTEEQPFVEAQIQLQRVIEDVRGDQHLPSLACAVVIGPEILSAVAGSRKVGMDDPSQLEDIYHLGSISKSMTACIAGQLVQQGKVRWNSSLGEVFPDLEMNPAYRDVTLEQLIVHQSGLPANFAYPYADGRVDKPVSLAVRRDYLRQALAQPPDPTRQFVYSNVGYVVAATMLEQVSNLSWSRLLRDYIFIPLGMKSAQVGFRWSETDPEPWPHRWQQSAAEVYPPVFGNPRFLDGADQVRCNIEDLARYAQAFLRSGKFYHQLPKGYHEGWFVVQSSGLRGPVQFHNGSNTLNYAYVWIAPENNLAAVVTTNIGSDETGSIRRTEQAVDATMRAALGVVRDFYLMSVPKAVRAGQRP
jgi:CubicO group peptidase (beta-lactamase class C family)